MLDENSAFFIQIFIYYGSVLKIHVSAHNAIIWEGIFSYNFFIHAYILLCVTSTLSAYSFSKTLALCLYSVKYLLLMINCQVFFLLNCLERMMFFNWEKSPSEWGILTEKSLYPHMFIRHTIKFSSPITCKLQILLL